MGEFTVNCPQCREELAVSTDFIGQDVSCPACNFVFKVNAPAAAPIPAPPPQVAPTVAPIPAPPQAQPQMAPGAPVPPQMAPGAPVPPQMATGAMPGAPVPPKAKAPFNFMLFKLIASGASILLAFIMFAVVTCTTIFGGDTFSYSNSYRANSSYDGSVSVGQSSYATYRNARLLIANTNRVVWNNVLSNWGYFFLILAVVFAVFPKPETKKKDN